MKYMNIQSTHSNIYKLEEGYEGFDLYDGQGVYRGEVQLRSFQGRITLELEYNLDNQLENYLAPR